MKCLFLFNIVFDRITSYSIRCIVFGVLVLWYYLCLIVVCVLYLFFAFLKRNEMI